VTVNAWVGGWDFENCTFLFIILTSTIRPSRWQEIRISNHVWIKRPYHSHWKPSLDILRCECIWQWLTHYEWDVDCHLFLQENFWSVSQSRCSQTYFKVHKLTYLWVALWERYEMEMASPLHFPWQDQEFNGQYKVISGHPIFSCLEIQHCHLVLLQWNNSCGSLVRTRRMVG
jgi:hypothetical protein